MNKKNIFTSLGLFFILSSFLFFSPQASAEEMFSQPDGGGKIPKIPKTENDPILRDGGVYPMWGPVCQRYTYHTTYQDKEGRPPEYVRMFFNGRWIDVQKENPEENDYQKGVRYVYKFVPQKLGSNFFFFEASNGLGKAREGIIDSPGNGPVLFEGDFLDNEIALIDPKTGKKIWKFPTKEEWIGGLAMSEDGKYLAAQTSSHIYLFNTQSSQPLWEYSALGAGIIGGDVKGGVAISGDGGKIFASLGNAVYLFDNSSNKPVWQSQTGSNNPYNVAISGDGKYMAAATAGDESNQNSNLLILWSSDSAKPLWQYHAAGNFHDVSLSADGSFVAGSTGCPDRRAYIFSRDSNVPLVRSEMLTYDSPVNTAEISSDGSLAYFSTDGGPDSVVLALFSPGLNTPVWKFDDRLRISSRAMKITASGDFAAVANMKGDVYLLGKETSSPLKKWKINASTGAIDLSDDGSLIAAGGTDNKVHIFDVASRDQKETSFDEYVVDVAFSGNGQVLAAGTGGSVYFFESFADEDKTFPCPTIIEPPPMDQVMNKAQQGVGVENKDDDVMIPVPAPSTVGSFFQSKISLAGVIGFGTSALLLVIYLVVAKFIFKSDRQIALIKQGKIVIIVLVAMVIVSLSLILFPLLIKKEAPSPGKFILQREGQEEKGICGNGLCEPNLGESPDNCRQDCNAQ